MFKKVAVSVGICVAFAAQATSVSKAQTSMPTAPASSGLAVTTDICPLAFVVKTTAPLLGMPLDRAKAQMAYAKRKGFVQYSLGKERTLHDILSTRLTEKYGIPLINVYGQREWRIINPNLQSSLSEIITVSIGEKLNSGYFVTVDGRDDRQIVSEPMIKKKSSITTSYKPAAPRQMRGAHGAALGENE